MNLILQIVSVTLFVSWSLFPSPDGRPHATDYEVALFEESPALQAPFKAASSGCGNCYCCDGKSCFSHHEIRDGSTKQAHACTSGMCNDPECRPDEEDLDAEELAVVWNRISDGDLRIHGLLEDYPETISYNRERAAIQIRSSCSDRLIVHLPLTSAQRRALDVSLLGDR